MTISGRWLSGAIALLVCLTCLGGSSWWKARAARQRKARFQAETHSRRNYTDLEVGDRLCLPAAQNRELKSSRTVIIVASATCIACSVDRPFEEVVYDRARALGLPIVFVLPDRRDQDARAKELATSGRKVVRMDLHSMGVSRVPRFLSVSGEGTIDAMWTGSVAEPISHDVLDEITTGKGRPLYDHISMADFEKMSHDLKNYQLIALSELNGGSRADTHRRVIPPDELVVRVT